MDSPDWLYDNVWIHFVPLFKAAIEGIRSEMPDAAIALHIAGMHYSTDNRTAIAFFTKMKEAGVEYDIAGVSYPYPTTGRPFPQPYFVQQEFLAVFDGIQAIGKRAQILEFSYPRYAIDDPNFDTSMAVYGCTAQAQATFIRDLAQTLRGRAERINYWGADIFPAINGPGGLPADVETYSLFADAGTPMPGLDAMERLAADRLMDWAQQQYPALFPDAPASASFPPYYYRYHPTSGMYVGIDETTRSIVLHDGVNYNFANLGPLRSLIGWAS
jgi:hypothetical protein